MADCGNASSFTTKQRPELLKFKRQYFQLLPLDLLTWPDAVLIKELETQEWLFDELFDVEMITFPPPKRYQLRVLKELISRIETAINDPEEDTISDNLMSHLSSLLIAPIPSEIVMAHRKDYVTYTVPDNGIDFAQPKTLTLLESRSVISGGGTTGMRTWEAALHLGSYLASDSGRLEIEGKNVLELGAGTGFLSILCAKYLGATHVWATDGHEDSVDWIKANALLNDLENEQEMCTHVYRWGNFYRMVEVCPADRENHLEVVLGADVIYDQTVIPALVASLREFFDLYPGLIAILSATVRNERTFHSFLRACESNNFHIVYIDYSMVPAERKTGFFHSVATQIHILRITRPANASDPFAI